MAEVKFDPDTICELGWLFGAFARAFMDGFEAGFEDYEYARAENDMKIVHETEEALRRDEEKTQIGDCRKCWCDQCAKLEECTKAREGALPDGIRPFPCLECADGMRFKPCEETRCEDFEQAETPNNG